MMPSFARPYTRITSLAMPGHELKVSRTDNGEHLAPTTDVIFLAGTQFPLDRVSHIACYYGTHPVRYDVEVHPLTAALKEPTK